jgi:hypothetical protein
MSILAPSNTKRLVVVRPGLPSRQPVGRGIGSGGAKRQLAARVEGEGDWPGVPRLAGGEARRRVRQDFQLEPGTDARARYHLGMSHADRIARIRVELDDANPLVWRRVEALSPRARGNCMT